MMQKLQDYQPSKGALVWTAIGAAVVTMILGFGWGGWVTGGSAQSMAEEAAEDARAQLVATICVDKFVSAPGAANNLVELKEASSYQRDSFIQEGGWSNIEALDEPITEAADLCAERLAEMEGLPKAAIDTSAEEKNAG